MLINGQATAKKAGVPKEWAAVQQAAPPFSDAHGGTNTREFGYWFNYFWAEAATVADLTDTDKTDLTQAFLKVLRPAATGVGRFVPAETFGSLDWFERRKVLATLLRIGFDKVPPKSSKGAVKATDARDIFVDHLQATKRNSKTTGVPTARQIHLGFRADGRSYQDLVTQGGFHARARSAGQAVFTNYGLDQKWHPLSVKENADCLYLRKGQKNNDNCLHTVVSVAFKLPAVIDYPLLSDTSLFPLGMKDTATWDANDVNAARTHKYKVEVVRDPSRGNVIDHTESELRLYVLAMNKAEAYSTFAWQGTRGVANPFPEAAVNDIQLKHIVAELVITRKHFFGSNDLSLYDFDLKEVNCLPDADNLKARFGDTFPADLELKLRALIRAGKAELAGAMAQYQRKKMPAAGPGTRQAKQACPRCNAMLLPVQLKGHVC